jgi:Bacteriophage HK97-gp10, putative tail-component
MARVKITQRLDRAAIARILTSTRGPVARDLLVRGIRVQSQAKQNLAGMSGSGPRRIHTGRLRSSIAVRLLSRQGGLVARIGSNVHYALYVHEGTGVHGPRHRPIRPRTKRYLRFKPYGSTDFVFARQVAGMRPNKYLLRALPAARINTGGRRRFI